MAFNKELLAKFPGLLLRWNTRSNIRQMPWKGEKDPYRIWLSEIMLQQTRVVQGLKYYERFIEQFPDVHRLADARDEKIYKCWEGLGYYSRCKNLIQTARFISRTLNGKFPDQFQDILSLKGVGLYTASAIASFAFNLPHAVVDGNVIRVLTRIFGIAVPVDTANGKKLIAQLAFQLLDKKKPGVYNQALMDFGAVICKPYPICNCCVFSDHCVAFQKRIAGRLPVKSKTVKIRTRWFNYLLIEHDKKVYIRKRLGNDIWKNLHEFVLIESDSNLSAYQLLRQSEKNGIIKKDAYSLLSVSPVYSQQLSHQKIIGRFITLTSRSALKLTGFKLVSPKQLSRLAFPRLINSFFAKDVPGNPAKKFHISR